MKMDAAEPFNVPVNPEALGIPVSNFFHSLLKKLGTLIFCLVPVLPEMFDIFLLQFLPLNLKFSPFSVFCFVKFPFFQ